MPVVRRLSVTASGIRRIRSSVQEPWENAAVKPLPSIFVLSALVAVACTSSGEIFEPAPGLECSTDCQWTEQATLSFDARGAPSRADAIVIGAARWEERPELELRMLQGDDSGYSVADESTDVVVGALVVAGRRVVLLLPQEVPMGGWIVTTVRTCEGYEP